MNTIEEDILNIIIGIYIHKSRTKDIKYISFSKKQILETAKYNHEQVRNCLVRLQEKSFIYNRRYNNWKLNDYYIDLVEKEKIKISNQNELL